MLSEKSIIRQLKQGNITTFNTLFHTTYMPLYIYCRRYITDPEEAKDLLQNIYLRLWEHREDIDIHTSLNAYLYRAVHNECLNHLRLDNSSFSPVEENQRPEIIEPNDPYSECHLHDIEHIVEYTINQLPDQCRSIFRLSRINGLKNQEIATRLNISVRTVETQIYRALKVLKRHLKDYLV